MNRISLIRIMLIKGLMAVAWSCIILLPFICEGTQSGISSVNKYAWSESAGWVNLSPMFGGVTVEADHLRGYAWAENLGWIKLGADKGGPYLNTDATDWGVNRAGNGGLSGYAWSEACGWIRFDTDFSQVRIDPATGDFDGYAWSEQAGWIHLRNDAAGYKVQMDRSEGIDPNDRFAWAESAGWVNLSPMFGGVTLEADHLRGYAWAENLGWIKLGADKGGPYLNTDATDWGVNRAGNGDLSGYAWSEACGWIRFDTDFSRVRIDPDTGDFDGYAWSERAGWIHLRNDQAGYGVGLETGETEDVDQDGDGFSVSEWDCDDSDPYTYPGAPELCDGKDNDCDGKPSRSEIDADQDGWTPCMGDCKDDDPSRYPGAPELCDGFDNDCDGIVPAIESDDDGDKYRLCNNDCDDLDKNTYPGAFEMLDGKDNDCDGSILPDEMNEDGDDYMAFEECDDHDPDSYPGRKCIKVKKAIIVAGGGPYLGNNLWDSTRSCAVSAYSTLYLLGFTPEDIYYLTADHARFDDPNDPNGRSADDYASLGSLEYAITEWAPDPNKSMTLTGGQRGFVSDVLIYLVDHGGTESFRINEEEILYASDLDIWLADLQGMIKGRVILIIDACKSGSFLSALNPPYNGERIVISSTSDDEEAYIMANGAISFSNHFWTRIMMGANMNDAFDNARDAMKSGYNQKPLLDDNGNQKGCDDQDGAVAEMVSFKPQGWIIDLDAPVIGDVRVTQDTDPNNLEYGIINARNVTDSDGIKRVWATIWPPNPERYIQTPSNRTVIRLPEITLANVSGTNNYNWEYFGFDMPGFYQINVYAMDDTNNISWYDPRYCNIHNPRRRRAIILAGEDIYARLSHAEEINIRLAYNALILQRYYQEDIYFLCTSDLLEGLDLPSDFQEHGHHGPPSRAGLTDAATWVETEKTKDLVLYMIGEADDRVFFLNQDESITAQELGGWLDGLQGHIQERITVICDASCSGSFLPFLVPPEGKKRTVITSTWADQHAHFLFGGKLSFSAFFWMQVLNGARVEDAFINSHDSIIFTGNTQYPMLDDNGDGIFNYAEDGASSRDFYIGVGITLAGDEPIIGSICPEQDLDGDTLAGIWVKDITTTGTIKRVWGIIAPPGYIPHSASATVTDSDMELATVDLDDTGGGRYSVQYDGFSRRGPYTVTVYAMDENENISLPRQTMVYQYGDDDTPEKANVIFFWDPNSSDPGSSLLKGPQGHKFNTPGDQDWVKFYGLEGEVYEIVITREVDFIEWIPFFEIYKSDGLTLADIIPPGSWPRKKHLVWTCPLTGVYYIKIYNSDPDVYGAETRYELSVFRPMAGNIDGSIKGTISDALCGSALEGATIRAWIEGRPGGGSAISLPDGRYRIPHPSGPCHIEVVKTGYESQTREISVKRISPTIEDFKLKPFDIHLPPGINTFDPNSIYDPYNLFDPNNITYPGMKRKSVTSYGLLSCLGDPNTVSAISRFDVKTGCRETASYFMGKPSGIDFPVIRTESYLIYMRKESYFSYCDLLE
ncbi:MAG: MopE-related protein [bacterium]